MKAQQLKNSILQLAVQGKLVPQDPNDEPASVLLERIRAEKQRLVKEGKIKKSKGESVIFRAVKEDNSDTDNLPYAFFEKTADGVVRDITDEIPFDVPESWEWCRLSSLGQIVGGGTPKTEKSDNWSNGSIPWLTPADMKNVHGKYVSRGERNISEQGLNSSSARMIPKNSIVYSSRAPIGYIAITSNPLCTNQGFKSIVPFDFDVVHYLYFCIIERTPEILSRASGTTFKEISGTEFGQTLVPLPPLAEQYRIVEQIEELLPFIERYATSASA
jgi:type I restriction enzyme S subunit